MPGAKGEAAREQWDLQSSCRDRFFVLFCFPWPGPPRTGQKQRTTVARGREPAGGLSACAQGRPCSRVRACDDNGRVIKVAPLLGYRWRCHRRLPSTASAATRPRLASASRCLAICWLSTGQMLLRPKSRLFCCFRSDETRSGGLCARTKDACGILTLATASTLVDLSSAFLILFFFLLLREVVRRLLITPVRRRSF